MIFFKGRNGSITERKQNDIILKTKPIGPCPKDVPAKILLLHVSPTPTNVNPAKPKVKTPIRAALRFC